MFVIVNIESLKELSKLSPSVVKMLDKINILIKKQINIKKEEFKFSLLILLSVFKILWSIITFGDTSLKISITVDLKSIYNLKNLIPDDKINNHLVEIDISSPLDLYDNLEILFNKSKLDKIIEDNHNYYNLICNEKTFKINYEKALDDFSYLLNRWK